MTFKPKRRAAEHAMGRFMDFALKNTPWHAPLNLYPDNMVFWPSDITNPTNGLLDVIKHNSL